MKLIFKIRRPEGHIENYDASAKFAGMNPNLFSKIQKATKDAGRGDVLSYEWVDDRTAAEKAYDNVLAARAKVEAAESANYYDPASICAARNDAEKAYQAWAAQYPSEAAEKIAKREAEAAANKARIRNSDGYKAALEGRD